MPSPSNFNRRWFLRESCAVTLGAIAVSRLSWAQSVEHPRTKWALLSDTHIPADATEEYRGFNPVNNLNQIIPMVDQAAPVGMVICGDVARLEGLAGDYQKLIECIAPIREKMPLLMALGNHDNRDNFRAAFAESSSANSVAEAGGKHVVVVEQKPVRFIILDSLFIVNEVAGLLGKSQRDWLRNYLAQADDTPTVVFVHHTLGDRDGDLLDVPRMFEIVDPAKKVKAVFFGHSHVYSFEQRNGLHLVNLPAVGYSFNDNQPVGWVEAEFSETGASLRLNAIASNVAANGEVTQLTWR